MTRASTIAYRISGELKTGGWTVVYMMHRGATLDQSEKKLRRVVRDHSGSINYAGKFRLERMTTFISKIKTVGKDFETEYECSNCGVVVVDGPGEICKKCEEYEKECFAKIDQLIADGHIWRCARRQVYGDGVCECGMKVEI